MLNQIYPYFEYSSFILSLVFYTKFKTYSFYKYFMGYLLSIIVFEYLAGTVFYGKGVDVLNIFTFFEFNLVALIYYNLIKEKKTLNLLKILAIIFNIIYFISFMYVELAKYTVSIEGVFNSVFIILFFRELLNSDRILNYKKLLSFWVSVGFLLFYLASIPFFTLVYSNFFDNKIMFPILYSLIIVFHLSFIYGLMTCKKMED